MQNELSRGLKIMNDFYPERLVPMFVPPWNRIAPELIGILMRPAIRHCHVSVQLVYRLAMGLRKSTHMSISWTGGAERPARTMVFIRLLADARLNRLPERDIPLEYNPSPGS